MKNIIFLFSIILLASCSMSRAPSLNMLEKRADYDPLQTIDDSLKSLDYSFTPERTKPRIADIWVHPHEMPTGDYFRGGWIRVLITNSLWEVKGE